MYALGWHRKDKTHRSIQIFKPASKSVGRWVTGYAIPAGWKTKADLTADELEMVAGYMGWETSDVKRERAIRRMQEFKWAYDPLTLDCKLFNHDKIPDGWVLGMVTAPEKMLKARIGTERSCLTQCKDESARAKISERLAVLLDMLEREAYDEALSDPSISGIYEMDGRRMFLRNWAEEYGIKLSTLRRRMSYGWELRRALTKKSVERRVTAKPKTYRYGELNMSLSAWSARTGIPSRQILRRMKDGKSFEQAISEPYQKMTTPPKEYDCLGKKMTLRQMSQLAGVPMKVIRTRIGYGWSPEEAALRPKRDKRISVKTKLEHQ